VVPSARVRLAVNKRTGALREYLEELKRDDSRRLERWFYSNWLEKMDPETKYLLRDEESSREDAAGSQSARPSMRLGETGGVGDGRDAEDSLEEVVRKARRAPRFWSADNPVLAGAAVTILGAALLEALSQAGRP